MLFEPLFAHTTARPRDLALIDDRGQYTYEQLAAMAISVADLLRARTAASRVGVLLPTGAAFVGAFYGGLLAGKTIVPINFLLGKREIAHVIADSGIDTVVTVPALGGALQGTPLNLVDFTQIPPTTQNAQAAQLPSAAPDDVAVLIYTSGTGGLPKGVPLTYANLQSDVDASIAHANFRSQHKFLGIIPLFHAFGMIAMMLAPIQLGAPIVYMARFNPVATVKAIREQGISLFGGVPSMFAAMLRLKDASPEDFKSIYAIISGGEPLPGALADAFYARFGARLYEAYGMTETSLAIALNTPQAHKPGSVGTPVPGIEIKIVNDAGNTLAAGEIGEICVRGPMVMKGYHNLPVETAAAFTPDGYFKTGDLGRMDADGFLYITGRKKDLIIVAGENVSPREIEETLMSHPAVAEAAVIGQKDASRGEVVVAFVITREQQSANAQELRDFCRASGLPQWKIPREIHLVQDLPRSPTGKVLKRELAGPAGQ